MELMDLIERYRSEIGKPENTHFPCPIKTSGGAQLFCNCRMTKELIGVKDGECREGYPCPTHAILFEGVTL